MEMSVLVCANLAGKKPHNYIIINEVIASRSLGTLMAMMLASNDIIFLG